MNTFVVKIDHIFDAARGMGGMVGRLHSPRKLTVSILEVSRKF